MDSYCDYLKRLTVDGIEDDYMDASSIVQNQLDQYDVTDNEIKQYLASL
jgi:hypothetical protein